MPRLKPRKFAPDAVVRCVMPYAGPHGVFNRSSRLSGDHEAVRANPEFWVLEGTPLEDEPSFFSDVVVNRDTAGIEILQAATPDQLAVATDTFMAAGRWITRGQQLRRDDELVLKHPQFFASVSEPLEAP